MTELAVNIGMRTSAGYGVPEYTLCQSRVERALNECYLTVLYSDVRQSNTEQTYVAVIRDDHPLHFLGLRDRIKLIARRLYQDCIAVRPDGNRGELLGPHADRWGSFDPLQFIEPRA